MRSLFLGFSLILLSHAVVFSFISLKALIINQPSIINSKWSVIIFFFSLIPIMFDTLIPFVIDALVYFLKYGLEDTYALMGLIISILPILLIIICPFFIVKGYSVYCINDADFRDSVIFSLNNASVKFEEKLNEIYLTELNNKLSIVFAKWDEGSAIKLKNKKDKIIFMQIIDGIKQFFKGKNIKPKKMAAIYYLIFSIFLIIFGAGSAMLFINNFYHTR